MFSFSIDWRFAQKGASGPQETPTSRASVPVPWMADIDRREIIEETRIITATETISRPFSLS